MVLNIALSINFSPLAPKLSKQLSMLQRSRQVHVSKISTTSQGCWHTLRRVWIQFRGASQEAIWYTKSSLLPTIRPEPKLHGIIQEGLHPYSNKADSPCISGPGVPSNWGLYAEDGVAN